MPTRLTNNIGTLIYNLLCKLTEATLDTMSSVLIKTFSDHQPYFILLNNVQTMNSPPVYVKTTKQDKESIQNFYNEIFISNELTSLNDNQDLNPNITYNILRQVIQNTKNKHIPYKLFKYNNYNRKSLNGLQMAQSNLFFICTMFIKDSKLLLPIPYNLTYKK